MPLDQAKQIAYSRRKDYLSLLAQLHAAELDRKAVKYQRAPSLSMGGYYGVSGQTDGLYHGVFLAQGTLNVPVFHEAKFRGDSEVVDAQLSRCASRSPILRSPSNRRYAPACWMCRRRRSW